MKRLLAGLLAAFSGYGACAQHAVRLADSLRRACHIPELAYAIVSADSVLDAGVVGWKKAHTRRAASLQDRFRIGSNTKALTGFIAAELVRKGTIAWDRKFFDLFPELKAGSWAEYRDLTLLQLLSFRTRLVPYTYTNAVPKKGQFPGTVSRQRYDFARWAFRQPPAQTHDSIGFSNLSYVAAGLMLEKASGRSYGQLVESLGASLGATFGLGQPNQYDTLQVWGHDAQGRPEPPADGYKLQWLQAAGNVNTDLPSYIRFLQLQLQGLAGKSPRLSGAEFNFLHFGLKTFAVGWFWETDAAGRRYSYNTGNPGSFLSKVYVCPEADRAIVLLANIQTGAAEDGLNFLLDCLKRDASR